MRDLDNLIRKIKPKVPILPKEFSTQVLKRIRQEKIEITPHRRWINQRSVMLLLTLALFGIGVLLLNLLFFEIKSNGSLELLYFGSDFLLDFFKFIPFDTLFIAIIILLLTSWSLQKSNIVKIGIVGITAISLLFSGLGGAALAISNLNENVQQKISDKGYNLPFFSQFYNDRARYRVHLPRFQFGKIVAVHDHSFVVENPFGEEVEVRTPVGSQFKVGQIIRMKGRFLNRIFHAQRFQHCNQTRACTYFVGMRHGYKGMINRPGYMRRGWGRWKRGGGRINQPEHMGRGWRRGWRRGGAHHRGWQPPFLPEEKREQD